MGMTDAGSRSFVSTDSMGVTDMTDTTVSAPLAMLRAYCGAAAARGESITALECAPGCTCIPGQLCGACEARGYKSALAGYAARIYPARVTPADDAREARVHYIAPDCDDIAPYDTCANCGQPAIERRGELVTMLTGNPECYGNTYRPEH